MAVHGQLSAFNSTEDDWQSYTERLEFYFTANNIEDAEKRRAILLSVCVAATYKRIKSLISLSKPTEKSFDEIVQLMSDQSLLLLSRDVFSMHDHGSQENLLQSLWQNSKNLQSTVISVKNLMR